MQHKKTFKSSYQIKEQLYHWRMLCFGTHIVNIAQIEALELIFVSLDKLAGLVLSNAGD